MIDKLSSVLYESERYWELNPSFHSDEAHFKYIQLVPFIENVVHELKREGKSDVKVLDIGGGSGYIGSYISLHLQSRGLVPYVTAVDISSRALETQKKVNNKIIDTRVLNLCSELINFDEHYDLALMIDVVEHVDSPDIFMGNVRRLSKRILFNIPLEVNLADIMRNIYFKGDYYLKQKDALGHIQFFSRRSAKRLIAKQYENHNCTFVTHERLMSLVDCEDSAEQWKSKLRSLELRLSKLAWRFMPEYLLSFTVQGSLYGFGWSQE